MVLDGALLAARLLLVAVFLIAGLTKLQNRSKTGQALREFGLPSFSITRLTVLLPVAELVVGLALIPTVTSRWAAIVAIAMLAIFTLGTAVNLVRGRRPDCRCFGQLTARPISGGTIVRNAILMATAGIVAWRPGGIPSGAIQAFATVRSLEIGGIALEFVTLLLIAAEAWLLIQLLSQNGRLLLRLDGLEVRLSGAMRLESGPPPPHAEQPAVGIPVGASAPSFRLEGLYGETLTLDALLSARKPAGLIFVDPGCGPCKALLPEVSRWQHEYVSMLTLVVISRGVAELNEPHITANGVTQVLLQKDNEIAEAYHVRATPSMVIVQPDGKVGSPVATGYEAIHTLFGQIVNGDIRSPLLGSAALAPNGRSPAFGDNLGGPQVHERHPLKVGDPAPGFVLSDLADKRVDLKDLRGADTLVLFWNPTCGFCQQMAEELRSWEAHRAVDAPRLLIVSTGSVESNRAMNFRSPVVLEPAFETGARFGVTGTPSALLIDAKGRIASEVAVGAAVGVGLAKAEGRAGSTPTP